jgi:hypothetical protein
LQYAFERILKLPKAFTSLSLGFGSAYHRVMEWAALTRMQGHLPVPMTPLSCSKTCGAGSCRRIGTSGSRKARMRNRWRPWAEPCAPALSPAPIPKSVCWVSARPSACRWCWRRARPWRRP